MLPVPASASAPKAAPVPKEYTSYRVKPRTSNWSLERSRASDGTPVISVSDKQTGLFGVGSTENQAIRDLLRAKREHREVLERQDKLSPALRRQLRHLKQR
jgi:hypothetical protein